MKICSKLLLALGLMLFALPSLRAAESGWTAKLMGDFFLRPEGRLTLDIVAPPKAASFSRIELVFRGHALGTVKFPSHRVTQGEHTFDLVINSTNRPDWVEA